MSLPAVYGQVTKPRAEVDISHRQLLSIIDGQIDSDRDGTTDDDMSNTTSLSATDDPEGLLGFSIGPSQDLMKSPTTPATKKAQVLEQSRSYFSIDSIFGNETDGETAQNEGMSPGQSATSSDPSLNQIINDSKESPRPSRLGPTSTQHKQSSFTQAMRNAGTEGTRKRSSSGPAVHKPLRKRLPDSPMSPLTKIEQSQDSLPSSATPQPLEQNLQMDSIPSSAPQHRRSTQEFRQYGMGLDGNVESGLATRDHKPDMLRRITSDGSLYLKRTVTGASDFDDTTAWGDVAEQVNSRFKAITDSFQDSSLKMPKMPNIGFSSSRPTPERSNSDITKENTRLNTGSTPFSRTANILKLNEQGTNVNLKESKHPILTEALSKTTGDLVIMGGYRGSVLRDAAPPNRQLWVPVKVGLNLRKVDLEVGLTREDELKMEEKIIPSGTLSHVGPVDICRRLIRKCRKCENSRQQKLRIHDWGYDWRLSPELTSERLIKFLETLKCNQNTTPVDQRGAWIIAHSLGGLVTRHIINRRPELVAGVVFAGVPQNCVNILGPLRNGDDVLFSSRVLTAQVNFTLRTSYALLPENGRCFLNKVTGERYDVDFFDVKTWDEYRLTPCISQSISPTSKTPRKSIVGTISESILSYTPSLPTKRLSWFSGSDTLPTGREEMKEKVEDAKEGISDVAKRVTSPEEHVTGQSLEPSMKSSSNKPSIATACTIPRHEAYEYLERTLAEIKRFKTELHHDPSLQESNRYPPHAIIFGKGVPTVYGAKVVSREAIKFTDAFDELAFAAGDGVVLASAAQLPQGYRCVKNGRVESDRGHVGILGDLEGVGKCLSAVIDARRKGVGMGNFT